MTDPPTKTVIVAGNPIDGVTIIGPFDDEDDALEHAGAELNGNVEWWLYTLESPNPEGTNG